MDDRAPMVCLGERVREYRFISPAIGRPARYVVFLPRGFSARGGARVPAVYLLHGAGRNCRSLFDAPAARRLLLNAGFATVMPDGGMGWWADSPAHPGWGYATLVGEVIADAERRLPIGGAPERRALCGWSMGGFGCVRYAENHAQAFCAVASMIGLLDWPNSAWPKAWNHAVPACLGPSPERFNPILACDRLRGLQILLVTGDRAFDYKMNRQFHERLAALRIPHTYRVLPGESHSFRCVVQALGECARFFDRVFPAGEKQSSGGAP